MVLELTEGFSGDLIDALLNESMDLAIVDTPSHPHSDLDSCQLWVETLQLVGPGGGRVTTQFGPGPLPIRDLAEIPIIMPSRRYAIRRLFDAAFERQHLKCKPAIEANGAMMILQLVKAGFGYTLMPSNSVYPWTASGELQAISVRPASGPGWSLGPMGTHNMPIEDYATIISKAVGRLVFEQAGLTPADIDVAQIYDAFTGLIPMSLEDYGFCARGEGGPFVAAGNLAWPNGGLPANTSGGLLSEAYLHGMNLLIEGVRQMRGTSTCQVEDARTCLVTSGGGGGHKSAAILGR